MFPAYIAETVLPQFINKLAEIIIPEKRTALSLQDKMRQFILPLPQNSVLKLLSQLSLYLFIPLSRSFIDIDFPADAAIICAVRGRALEPFKIIRFSHLYFLFTTHFCLFLLPAFDYILPTGRTFRPSSPDVPYGTGSR